jgi:hypothetical protein
MPNIHHELIIGAAVTSVYQAITSQQGLSAWWTPQTTAKAEIGSTLRFSFGTDYFKEMKLTALNPYDLVNWDCISGASEWVGTKISFKLYSGNQALLLQTSPEAAGQIQQQVKDSPITLLKFEHNNWENYTPMFAECNYTWGQFLRSLKLFCETGKGKPWPHQHN